MRELSKNAILDAAGRLFAERGYDAVSIAEIARRAGVSVGLTMYYFRTKAHLLQALADRTLHRRVVEALDALGPHTTVEVRLAAAIDAVLDTAAAEPVIIALHLALLLQPGAAEQLVDAEHTYEERLVGQIHEIMSELHPEDPRGAQLLLRATLMGAAYSIVSPYLPLPPATVRRHVFRQYGLDPDRTGGARPARRRR